MTRCRCVMLLLGLFATPLSNGNCLWAQDSAVTSPGEAEVPEAVRLEINQFVDDLRAAVEREDPDDVARMTHIVDTLLDAMKLAGLTLPDGELNQIRTSLPQAMGRALIFGMSDWSRHTLRFLEYEETDHRCVVLLRMITRQGQCHKLRLSLQHQSDGWKIVDYEDQSFGMSLSSVYHLMVMQLVSNGVDPRLFAAFQQLNEVIRNIAAEEFYGAAENLKQLDDVDLPDAVDSVRWMCAATVALFEENVDQAFFAIERARAINEEMPALNLLKSYAHLQAEQYEESLAEAETFVTAFGPDPDAAWPMGLSLHYLGRTNEALTVLIEAAKATPESPDLVVALGISLPDARKQEVGEWFLKLTDSWDKFEEVADQLIEEEQLPALDAILKVAGTDLQGHPLLAWYRSEILVANEEYSEAADLVFPELERHGEEYDGLYKYRFVDCMVLSDRHLEAYGMLTDKEAAFESLADLTYLQDLYAPLDELITLHRHEFPTDGNSWWYEGLAFTDHEEWESADEAFATADSKADESSADGDVWVAGILSMRILCWVEMDRVSEGCRTLGTTDEVISGFAEHLLLDEKVAVLKNLLQEFPLTDPALRRRWDAQSAFLDGRYDTVVQLLPTKVPGPIGRFLGAPGDPLSAEESDLLIRSLIRTESLAEAEDQARKYEREYKDSLHLAMVFAAQENIEQSAQLLRKCVADDGLHYAADVLSDELLKEILARPALAGVLQELRERAKVEEEEYGYPMSDIVDE